MARRSWLRTYSARFSGSFSVAADGRERLEDAREGRERSRLPRPAGEGRPSAAPARPAWERRFAPSQARTARARRADVGPRPAPGSPPPRARRRFSVGSRTHVATSSVRDRIGHLAAPAPAPRAGRERRCRSARSARTRTRGAGNGTPSSAKSCSRSPTAIARSPAGVGVRAIGSRSSLTSRLQGTTSGTNAGSRALARARSTGDGSVAARCCSAHVACARALPDEHQRERRSRRTAPWADLARPRAAGRTRPRPAAPWARRAAAARAPRRAACPPPRSRRA